MLNNQMVIGRDGVLNFCQPYLGWGESSKSAILGGTVPELRTPTWIHMVIDQGGLTKWTDPFWTTLNAFVVSFERVPWPVHEDVATSCGWWFPFLFSCNRFRVRGRNMAKPPVTCSLHISMAQKWMNFPMYGLLFHVIRYGNTWKSFLGDGDGHVWAIPKWLRVFVFFTTLKASSVVSAQIKRPPVSTRHHPVSTRR